MNPPVDPIRIEVYRLLRERFAPLARCGGPLFAGVYSREGMSGEFYIDQLSRWLWLPNAEQPLRPEDVVLSDKAVAGQTDVHTVVVNLLRNVRLVFELYEEQVDRIKSRATFVADLGVYLTNEIALVVDAIALRGRPWK